MDIDSIPRRSKANPWKLTEFFMLLMDYVMAFLEKNEECQLEQVFSHLLNVDIWK